MVYVWGTGMILCRVIDYRIKLENVIAFIDNNPKNKEYMGKKVIKPTEITEDYDAIIVANSYSREIYEHCKELNIDLSKLIFLYNNLETVDYNKDYYFVEKILGKEYADIVKSKYHIIRSVAVDEVKKHRFYEFENDKMYKEDYVRVRTLELAISEIKRKNIEGAVAELGVFRGNFAKYINTAFPDRKMYLFDTFEGFGEQEAAKEKDAGNVNDAFINPVKNTSIELVMSKMKYKDNIIIKQGFFPESLGNGLEEKFALVSLDVDFEESTVSGLEYFYPRLSVGGYIFIHDYNYGYYDSVIKAVDKFENKTGISLCKVPICDADGTLVITK